MFKLIILDVDGVLTDGKKHYDSSGLGKMKVFCDLDFTAIKKFKAKGIPIVWLSGDSFNENLAKQRNIDFLYSRGVNKLSFLSTLCEKYGCTSNDVVYVGDDIFDYDIMLNVGKAYCTNQSPHMMLNKFQSLGNGGDYLVSKLYDILFPNDETDISLVMKLDELERF